MSVLSNEKARQLEKDAYRIRELSLRMMCVGHWGHLGGSLSLAEILAVLYGEFVRLDPAQPRGADRDMVILSKAHCSPALYAALALRGVLREERLYTYCQLNGLDGHLHQPDTPGVESCGGSLGLGLSYSIGLALSMKKQERFAQRTYCIVGDGELTEGEMWEAIMSASQYRLDNLIMIVDHNKVMAKDFVYNEVGIEPLGERLAAFGWSVIEADGHDVRELYRALYRAKYICAEGKPVAIVAHTVKGRGIRQCEFNYKWHTHAPGRETANAFLYELAEARQEDFAPVEQPIRKTFTLQDVVEGGLK